MISKTIYHHGSPARIGVLLINLGTPDAPTAQALRPYLREFLSNPRVIEVPRLIWWPILYGFLLAVNRTLHRWKNLVLSLHLMKWKAKLSAQLALSVQDAWLMNALSRLLILPQNSFPTACLSTNDLNGTIVAYIDRVSHLTKSPLAN